MVDELCWSRLAYMSGMHGMASQLRPCMRSWFTGEQHSCHERRWHAQVVHHGQVDTFKYFSRRSSLAKLDSLTISQEAQLVKHLKSF